MQLLKAMLTVTLSVLCGACSVHPLPENVTGYNTYEIVQRVRCEMRQAVADYAIGIIAERNKEEGEALLEGRKTLAGIDRRSLHPETQKYIETYDGSLVGYEFTFDITETNNEKIDAGFLRVFDDGPFKLGISASTDKKRKNTRNFRIIDSFENLQIFVESDYCDDSAKSANWIYPITGKIGLEELVGTFLDLNQSGNLGSRDEKIFIPLISDTIEFTTKLTGSVNPTIELAAVGGKFQLGSAGFKADVSREDIHKVVVVLSLPPEDLKQKGPVARTRAEKSVEDELDRQQTREFTTELKKVVEE